MKKYDDVISMIHEGAKKVTTEYVKSCFHHVEDDIFPRVERKEDL